MELLVKEVVPSKSSTGKFYQRVTCGDGVTYYAWDYDFLPHLNQVVSVEIITKGSFKNIKMVENAAAAPAVVASTTHTPKNTTGVTDFDVRKTSVLCALETLEKMGERITKEGLITKIMWYEAYFTSGSLGVKKDNE